MLTAHSKAIAVAVALAHSCLSAAACSCVQARPRDGASTMTRTDPFELHLHLHGHRLVAELRNISASPQRYLHSSLLQPSSLTIKPPDGPAVTPDDMREISKYDSTVHCADFLTLAPKAKVALLEAAFKKGKKGYSLSWGPYSWTALSGRYGVSVTWQSAITTCVDDTTGKQRPVPGLWTGAMTTPPVVIVLDK
jgi:hypothetical protein